VFPEALFQGPRHFGDGHALSASDLVTGSGDALLRRWVGQQLERRLDGLKIFSCEQDDVVFAVFGDVDSLIFT